VASATIPLIPYVEPVVVDNSGGTALSGTALPGTALQLKTTDVNGAGNSTFLDSSTNALAITASGTPTQGTFSPFLSNWSNYLGSSTNSGISFAYNGTTPIVAQGTDYTLEGWFYLSQTPGGNAYNTVTPIACTSASNTNAGNARYWGFGSSTFLYEDRAAHSYNTITYTFPIGKWFHFAFVASNTGTNYTLFVDGNNVGTATDTGSYYNDSSFVFVLGAYNGNQSWTANGMYVSNFRYTKKAVYTGNFTVPTAPLTATQSSGTNIAAIATGDCTILTAQNNRYVDNGSLKLATTAPYVGGSYNGIAYPAAFTPFGQSINSGSGYFNGSASYLVTGSSINLYNADYTIEFWAYTDSTNASYTAFIQSNTGYNNWVPDLAIGVTSGKLQVSINGIDSGATTVNIPANQWTHIALVYTVANNTNTYYINGLPAYTWVRGLRNQTFALNVARATNYAGYDVSFKGYISNFRIVKGTAVYTAAFTPPTAPVTAVTGTTLLCNFDKAGIYDKAGSTDLLVTGAATVSTTQSKFGGSSVYFNGSSYLSLPTTHAITLGAGDFTIEGWMYLNNVSGSVILFDQRPATTQGIYPTLYMSTTFMRWYTNSATMIESSALSALTWYHFAVCRSGTSTKMFINGVQVGSTYTDSNNYLVGRTIIGASAYDLTGQFNGYLDDFRISKTARYTANFTPPTEL